MPASAVITSMNTGIYGAFFYDSFSFLAYNPNQNVTFGSILKSKLSTPLKSSAKDTGKKNPFTDLEGLVLIDKLKIL